MDHFVSKLCACVHMDVEEEVWHWKKCKAVDIFTALCCD